MQVPGALAPTSLLNTGTVDPGCSASASSNRALLACRSISDAALRPLAWSKGMGARLNHDQILAAEVVIGVAAFHHALRPFAAMHDPRDRGRRRTVSTLSST